MDLARAFVETWQQFDLRVDHSCILCPIAISQQSTAICLQRLPPVMTKVEHPPDGPVSRRVRPHSALQEAESKKIELPVKQ